MVVDTYCDLEWEDALIMEEAHVLKLVVEEFDNYDLQRKMIYYREVVVVLLSKNWGDSLLEVQEQHVEEECFCACHLNEVVVGAFENLDRFLSLISVDEELVKLGAPYFGRQKQIKELYLVLYQVVDQVYLSSFYIINKFLYTIHQFINLFDSKFQYMGFNFYW